MGMIQLVQQNGGEVFPSVEACYAWTWQDFHMDFHRHARAEIMYLLKGSCCIRVRQDGRIREICPDVGEFVFLDADVEHALLVDESYYMMNVEFSLTGVPGMVSVQKLMQNSEIVRNWLSRGDSVQIGTDPDGNLCSTLAAVVEAHRHREAGEMAFGDLKMAQLLVLTASALTQDGRGIRSYVHVRRCIKLLSECLGDEVRVDDIAAEIGISASYLQRIFHQAMGMTIIEYLNKLRIERAKLLLLNTRDAVIDVAVASGFNSRQHFCRVFSAHEGCSPQQYRCQYIAIRQHE